MTLPQLDYVSDVIIKTSAIRQQQNR